MVLEIAALALNARPNQTEFKVVRPEPTPIGRNLRTTPEANPPAANSLTANEFINNLLQKNFLIAEVPRTITEHSVHEIYRGLPVYTKTTAYPQCSISNNPNVKAEANNIHNTYNHKYPNSTLTGLAISIKHEHGKYICDIHSIAKKKPTPSHIGVENNNTNDEPNRTIVSTCSVTTNFHSDRVEQNINCPFPLQTIPTEN
ncbi:MAG: hypothetical protein ACK481_00435 [Candidatus Melainabacteria bacterium]|jgi:hypothetical protein